MPGIVYSGGTADTTNGIFGAPINITAGAVVPPGEYMVTGNWNIGSNGPFDPGFVRSDGVWVTAVAAMQAFPLGGRGPVSVVNWPWPAPPP